MEVSQLRSESIFVSGKEQRYEKVFFQDILYFQAEGSWADLITSRRGKRYRISTNLGNVESQLDTAVFVRVSRKHIVNIHHVTAVQGNIVFIDDHEILIGRLYKDGLITRLPILRTKN